jgi:hypothetical protein
MLPEKKSLTARVLFFKAKTALGYIYLDDIFTKNIFQKNNIEFSYRETKEKYTYAIKYSTNWHLNSFV